MMQEIINQEIIPVILGVDMNAYGLARSFHEEYNIKSLVLGQTSFFHTQNTKILEVIVIENLQEEEILLKELLKIGEKYSNKKMFLMPTAEVYVEPIVNNKKELEKYFIIPSIEKELLYDLVRKDKFYDLCEKHNMPYPKTIILTKQNYKNHSFDFDFNYPIVVKPNNSRTYFRAEFTGKKKAYVIKTKEEAIAAVNSIYNSSYEEELIVQEFIPGDDDYMRLISTYSDKNGVLKHASYSHVLLEDHAPSLIGNPVVHLIEENKEQCDIIKKILDDLKYIGFANIDLKYDPRDDKIKAFDFNARLGRSSYFMTASGYNIAKFLMDDYIYNREIPFSYNSNEFIWTAVPIKIIGMYLKDKDLQAKTNDLIKQKKYARTLFYNKDMSISRRLKLLRMDRAYFGNFKVNYPK